MQVNIEIKLKGSETFVLVGEAIKNQPLDNSNVSCGYNNININYECNKNTANYIKKHWKNYINDCIVTSF